LRLRRKLKDAAGQDGLIQAVRGAGYMLVAETEIV